jgi:hypothetical protein
VTLRLRQACLVARDLDAVAGELCTTLGTRVAFRDPAVELFGLRNAVVTMGDQFVEVVSPLRQDTTAARFLERRGGDSGYMLLFETDDLARDRRRLERLAVRVVWEIELDDMRSVHLHPRDLGGAIVSLDQPRPPGAWRWAGPAWRDLGRAGQGLAHATIEANDPARMARRWAETLGLASPVERDARHEVALQGGVIRFVRAGRRGEGLCGVGVIGAGSGDVGGVRFEAVESRAACT